MCAVRKVLGLHGPPRRLRGDSGLLMGVRMDYAVLVYIWLVRNVVYARVNEMIVAQFGCAAVGGCR